MQRLKLKTKTIQQKQFKKIFFCEDEIDTDYGEKGHEYSTEMVFEFTFMFGYLKKCECFNRV